MSRQRRIWLDLVLDGREPVSPGSHIFFNLKVTTNRPIKILSAKATFRSHGRSLLQSDQVNVDHMFARAGRAIKVDQYSTRTLVLGTPRGRQDHGFFVVSTHKGTDEIRLHERESFGTTTTFTMRVRLNLPENIPDTWTHGGPTYTGEVRNTVAALVTFIRLDSKNSRLTPGVDEDGLPLVQRVLSAEDDVLVRNSHVPVERFGVHSARDHTAEQRVGVPFFRGRILCQLTVRDKLGLLGHDLPLLVEISNGSSKDLRKVSLALYQKDTFKSYNHRQLFVPVYSTERRLFKAPLPSIAPNTYWHREVTRFTIPDDCLTSASLLPSSFVTLRFFVRLKVKWWFGAMKCEVPVHIGTHGVQSAALNSTYLEQHEILV